MTVEYITSNFYVWRTFNAYDPEIIHRDTCPTLKYVVFLKHEV